MNPNGKKGGELAELFRKLDPAERREELEFLRAELRIIEEEMREMEAAPAITIKPRLNKWRRN